MLGTAVTMIRVELVDAKTGEMLSGVSNTTGLIGYGEVLVAEVPYAGDILETPDGKVWRVIRRAFKTFQADEQTLRMTVHQFLKVPKAILMVREEAT